MRDRTAERRATELMRAAILAWYGQECACCGTTESLGIDHVGGDGPAQRTIALGRPGQRGYNPATLLRWIITSGFPEGFQTMCRPCNSSKGAGGACRLHGAAPPAKTNAEVQADWRARQSSPTCASTAHPM
jgi:hypothetical protein